MKKYITVQVSDIPTYQVYKFKSTNDDGTLEYELAENNGITRIFLTIDAAEEWIKRLEKNGTKVL